MTRPLHLLALAALLLAVAGCSFERRPNEEAGGPPDTIDAIAAAIDTMPSGAPAPWTVEEARSFFREVQEARSAGRLSAVRSRLDSQAVLMHRSRRVSTTAPAAELEPLLTPDRDGQVGSATVEEIIPLASGVLFVVRYPSAGSVGGSSVETVLVVRDPAGWSVRFLQRTDEASG